MSYGFFIPTVSIMGRGACDELPAQVKNLGCTKPLLVTDAGITHAGLTDQIVDQLKKDAGVEPVVFGGVVPNPTDTNVEDGLTMYKDNGCDSIISLGGGSVHDAAKGIAMVATNDCKIHELEGLDIPEKAMPPFIAINTTAGTASEMTRFCIITDTTRKVKMAIVTWRCTPNVAINDPLLMVGKPAALTAATGMDALTHAVEAFVSIAATPITDACAIKAISLI